MTIAQDAKLRRAMRNKARRNGDPMGLLDSNQGARDNLLATYQRATKRNDLIQSISGDYSPEANKLRKQLQNHWYNRGEKGPVNPKGTLEQSAPVVRGKEKAKGKSIPLIHSF